MNRREPSLPAIALQPPDPRFRIRQATPADAAALCADCWPDRPLERAEELLRLAAYYAQQGAGCGAVVLAEATPGVLAYGQLLSLSRCGEISDLIVAPACRSQGIGTALIQYLVQAAQRYQMNCVEIGAALSNPRALALYQRLGFRPAYTLALDLGQGPESVRYLQLALPPPAPA